MNKNDLDHIIAHYTEEEKKMKIRLEECLAENDFLAAHHLSKILNGLRHKIALLSELDGSRDLKIQRQEFSLQQLEKKWKTEEDPKRKKILEQFMAQAKEKIANWQKQAPAFFEDKQLIDETILDLLAGKISGFSLVVDRREAIELDFQCPSPSILRLSIQESKSNDFYSNFWKPKLSKLQGLGFVLSEDQKHLTLNWPMEEPADTQTIKLVLARIFFEVFSYKDFGTSLNLIIRT